MRTFWAVLVGCLAIACGSSTSEVSSNDTTDGGAGGLPAGCPASPPTDGSPCTMPTRASCNYDCGGNVAECVNGRWTVAVSARGCTSGQNNTCPAGGAVAPLSHEALGDPCSDTPQCQDGLTCEHPYLRGGTIVAQSLCTVRCDGDGHCPNGSTCTESQSAVSTDAGIRKVKICVPSCETDTDCQKGNRAGRCTPSDGGVRVCEPLSCYGDCPKGFSCVGGSCPGPGSEAPNIPGFCQRTP